MITSARTFCLGRRSFPSGKHPFLPEKETMSRGNEKFPFRNVSMHEENDKVLDDERTLSRKSHQVLEGRETDPRVEEKVIEEEDKVLDVSETFARDKCKVPRENVSMIEEDDSMRPVDGSMIRASVEVARGRERLHEGSVSMPDGGGSLTSSERAELETIERGPTEATLFEDRASLI
jgi:hypothetical protein